VHVGAGLLAILLLVGFWTSSAAAVVIRDLALVRTVKHTISAALWILIPSLAATALSGEVLARRRGAPLVRAKRLRARAAMLNGLLVLLPTVLSLEKIVDTHGLVLQFFALQVLELLAGAANLTLLVQAATRGRALTATRRGRDETLGSRSAAPERPASAIENVLVTGATGYIGSALVERLLREGYAVHALVRDPNAAAARGLEAHGATLVAGDVRDSLPALDVPIQSVVHLAVVSFPGADQRVNVHGALRVIGQSCELGLQVFVYVSSALVYGPSDPACPVSERTACAPNSAFARGQLRVETRLRELARANGFPAVILRPGMVIGGGGGELPKLIEKLEKRALPISGSGRQILTVTDRDDLIDAIVQCHRRQVAPGTTLNICTPGTAPVGPLYRRIARARGAGDPIRLPAPVVLCGGLISGFVQKLLGRRPTFDLDTAKVSLMTGGERRINRARDVLGFSPRHPNALDALSNHHPEAR
jgi:nucleoside-diphosphate-sugar epimerase